jgi:hypothetical protein
MGYLLPFDQIKHHTRGDGLEHAKDLLDEVRRPNFEMITSYRTIMGGGYPTGLGPSMGQDDVISSVGTDDRRVSDVLLPGEEDPYLEQTSSHEYSSPQHRQRESCLPVIVGKETHAQLKSDIASTTLSWV